MNNMMEKLALLNKKEAEDKAVGQFTNMYEKVNEKELDMPKLEFVLRNTFYAGMLYKEAVMKKEKESTKSYEDGIKEMRDIAIDADGDEDFFDKVWNKADELISEFNS